VLIDASDSLDGWPPRFSDGERDGPIAIGRMNTGIPIARLWESSNTCEALRGSDAVPQRTAREPSVDANIACGMMGSLFAALRAR